MSADERSALAARIGVVTIERHALSPFNACMVYSQIPAASIVGGFQQWRKAGRIVRKGEHGAAIWVPIGKREANTTEPVADGREEKPGFVLGTVFDVSQTKEIDAESAVLA